MTMKGRPVIKNDAVLDSFIAGAKAKDTVPPELPSKDVPIIETPGPDIKPEPIKLKTTGIKTMLIKLDQQTWYTAKIKAVSSGMTLHDYIVEAVRDRNK